MFKKSKSSVKTKTKEIPKDSFESAVENPEGKKIPMDAKRIKYLKDHGMDPRQY